MTAIIHRVQIFRTHCYEQRPEEINTHRVYSSVFYVSWPFRRLAIIAVHNSLTILVRNKDLNSVLSSIYRKWIWSLMCWFPLFILLYYSQHSFVEPQEKKQSEIVSNIPNLFVWVRIAGEDQKEIVKYYLEDIYSYEGWEVSIIILHLCKQHFFLIIMTILLSFISF